MSELTLLLLRIGFLLLLWFFVFAVVYSLRADLFGVKVRRMPDAAPAAAAACRARAGRGIPPHCRRDRTRRPSAPAGRPDRRAVRPRRRPSRGS